MSDIKVITTEELKEKLDRKDDFKLVMTMAEWSYQSMHIAGSLNIFDPQDALEQLHPDDEIVVYCSNEACPASVLSYHILVDQGYSNVRRYAAGVLGWSEAGYPLEGDQVG